MNDPQRLKYCGKEHWNHVEGWACVLAADHEGKCRDACKKEFVGNYLCLRPQGHTGDCEGNILGWPEEVLSFDPTIRKHMATQGLYAAIDFDATMNRPRYVLGSNHPHLKEPLTLANPTRPQP